jgi:hypothetical protein
MFRPTTFEENEMVDPLKNKIGIKDPQDPQHARYVRNLRSTNQLMKQFCKFESSVDKPAYDRGFTWNFIWLSEDPLKAQPAKVAAVKLLTETGKTFDEAFDEVVNAAGTP